MVNQLARNWWVLVLRGVAGVLFGLTAFFWPGVTLAVVVMFFGAYALIDGVFTITAAAMSAGENGRWWLMLLEGIAGVAVGVMTFFLPAITAVALVILIGSWSIVTGVLGIATAIRLRQEIEGEWLMALSGVLSIALGVMVLVWPLAGAIAFIWLIGSYAFLFGCLFIALGLRLRGVGRRVHTEAHA